MCYKKDSQMKKKNAVFENILTRQKTGYDHDTNGSLQEKINKDFQSNR